MSLLWVLHAIALEIAPLYLVVLVKPQELSAPPCAMVVEGRIKNVHYYMTCVAQGQRTVKVMKNNMLHCCHNIHYNRYINNL
jgi:hypothetical protein